MVDTIRATQAREGIETTEEQAERAYYIVTEAEKTAFFDLERFRSGMGQPERRHEMFVQALRGTPERVRFDVARRDFSAIDGLPLAYRRVGLMAHIFRDAPALEPAWGIARQGKATGNDSRWVRQAWEIVPDHGWSPFAKGGDYCRFYADIDLVLDWKPEHRETLQASGNGLPSLELYFKPGLTWPRRPQRGFNLRVMPAGCIFADKGPAIFPAKEDNAYYLLGIANSTLSAYLLRGLTSFGSWEVGVVQRLPIPSPTAKQRDEIGGMAKQIHNAKAAWDESNEICSRFIKPWLLRKDIIEPTSALTSCLDRLTETEAAEDGRIQKLYTELNNEVYSLYGIPESLRGVVEETLGERPLELIWPQMEGKTVEQKRMEHVWRLLSYVVKRVVEADEDGIVPFMAVSGEMTLLERVHQELAVLFPNHDVNQIEVEITNELKRKVKGYQRTNSIREWLEDVFFHYHVSLYKNRPIIWHISSKPDRGEAAFAALIQYHKFDRNRMAKLRSSYLREALNVLRREAGLASQAGRANDRLEWQSKIEETEALDQRLQWVQEGQHEGIEGSDRDFRILTPWKSTEERPKGWDPDLDDGVKVNIEPLQRAGVLRRNDLVR
ncbi:MAG: hypothetical protein ACRERE_34650 [Candidatus Entotheonellia bacterium]